MTTIHTRQLQQYTQDNYNNTHKTTTKIHTRQLTTIHTRHLKIRHVHKVNTTKVRKLTIILTFINFFVKMELETDNKAMNNISCCSFCNYDCKC